MKSRHSWIPVVAGFAVLAGMACSEPSSPPGSPAVNDPEHLFTDGELATSADALPVPVSGEWSAWLKSNDHLVRSLTSHKFDDLQFLKPVIGTRRLVQLGESGHGVREFSQAKVRLIQFLHEQMGFDVIAFESGLHECWDADRAVASASAGQTLQGCIFNVWNSSEVLALFDYIKQTRSTDHPLHLAGFDVQISSSTDKTLPTLFSAVLSPVDPVYASKAADLESRFRQDYDRVGSTARSTQEYFDSLTAFIQRGHLVSAYDSLASYFKANESGLKAKQSDPSFALLARQVAVSRPQFIRELLAGTSNLSFETRDEGMANNVDFLLNELYPGQKVILWAHNAHIQHNRAAMTQVGSTTVLPRSMGSWISQRHRPDLYTIGFFMYAGFAAQNDRQVYPISRPANESIEALFYTARKMWLFVDMLNPSGGGTSPFAGTMIGKEWGVTNYSFVPREQYDGILFVHTVSPPAYR